MSNGTTPPNKWDAMPISPKADPLAQSSTDVLNCLNTQYKITAAFSAVCSDGTFAFIGIYASH